MNLAYNAAVLVLVVAPHVWICGCPGGAIPRPHALDEEACEKAKKADSKEGWKAYLAEHPKGLCADQAREGMVAIERRADEAACKKTRDADTEAGWKAYLGEHPKGSCKAMAEKRLEEIAAAERERLAKIDKEKRAAKEKAKRLAKEKARRERLAKIEAEKREAEEKARRERLAMYAVKQPATNLYWLRCPIGQRWDGSSCEGKARRMIRPKARKECPRGYRLPTKQELMSLLGGCDAGARGGIRGKCNKCAESNKCSSMFGRDKKYYWSSSTYEAGPNVASNAYYVSFYSGNVDFYDKANHDYVRCVRSGP